jgi:hypothetical protein
MSDIMICVRKAGYRDVKMPVTAQLALGLLGISFNQSKLGYFGIL